MALKDLSIIEREIIGRYLDRVATLVSERPETRVRVFDGEFNSYMGSFDRSGIEHVIGDTDETHVIVTCEDDAHIVSFIHGNDEDVVSNSAWSSSGEWLEDKLLKGVYS